MKFLLLIFFISTVFAKAPIHWSYIVDVSDRHEFYKSGEVITHPRDAWQSLFGLVYIDRNLNRIKDCVFYRVPGEASGSLKLKTISLTEKCDDYLLKEGDREIGNIKSLQFTMNGENIKLIFSSTDFKVQSWEATVLSNAQSGTPQMGLSSAAFKTSKLIYLAPSSSSIKESKLFFLKPNANCHDIDDDCREVSPSRCTQCESGWYEIPNGCPTGPKFCGVLRCGEKHGPACRRGMKWQRKESDFDCRTDSSFAYCRKGLTVQCEGRKAFCQ